MVNEAELQLTKVRKGVVVETTGSALPHPGEAGVKPTMTVGSPDTPLAAFAEEEEPPGLGVVEAVGADGPGMLGELGESRGSRDFYVHIESERRTSIRIN
jgi:hypothetical protein